MTHCHWSFQRAHNARRLRLVAVDNRHLLKSDLKISRACFTSVASVWQGLTGCVKNECNATGFALYEQLRDTNRPLRLITFRYESRNIDPRSYSARGTDMSDAHPRQLKSSTTWKTCAQGRARRSYLRIDVSLNTLFIFVRYILTSRESSPQ